MSTIAHRLLSLQLILYLALGGLTSRGVPVTHAGEIEIRVEDPGRAIWVDGAFVGLGSASVSVDTHFTRVEVGEPPYSSRWVRPWRIELPLQSEPQTVVVPSLQRLVIRSEIGELLLEIDEVVVGQTPISILVPRNEVVPLRTIGGALGRASLRSEQGLSQNWTYDPGGRSDSTWVISSPETLASARGLQVESFDGKESWAARSRFLLPIGALIAGATGVWAKQAADRAYEDYEATVSQNRIESKYDRADSYDRIATACWLAAEALLVSSVISWLRGERGRGERSQSRQDSSETDSQDSSQVGSLQGPARTSADVPGGAR